jgi:DNA-binding NarL/FixJ family response regulator
MAEDDGALVAAVRAGACGYLLKGADGEDILAAVRTAARGGAVFGSGAATRALQAMRGGAADDRFPQLSEREVQVLRLLSRGLGNAAIARELGLSPKTVQNYVSTVLTKLGVPDRTAAALAARDAGLVG